MSTDSSTPEANLSALGRELLGTNEGSKPSGPWVPPTAEELHAILPQYEIVKMLGRGGMGAVYMGRQTALDRPVAIKIISAQLEESDMGFTERFKNEAKAMAKLNHPGIVSVYDFGGTSGGLLYIVMEYVDGTDVAKMIAKSGRLHTEHAMAITAHVCDALAYAHERGIIHRDIKPANIMVGYDGAVKVADFGLAKVNVGGQTLGLTQSGMAMGTMHYMAPEALMLGTSVDHRADIYAVGVMLYQMLTGKLPQGMFKLPSLLVPGLDPRYDAIVRKALMEDRESRYQSIREMRAELDSILTQPVVKVEPAASAAEMKAAALPTGARPQRPGGRPPSHAASTSAQTIPHERQRGSLPWLWVTIAVLLVLGGVGWFMFATPKQQAASIPQPPASSAPPTPAITEKTAMTAPPAAATPTPLPPGWISLFNGKDLSDWELHPSNFPADVQDGAIRIRGSSTIPVSGNMYYRGSGTALPQWTDFELICTVKTENKGNSGIYLHANPGVPDSNRATGVEVQILNDSATSNKARNPGSQSGGLQRLADAPVTFQDGEWFQVKVRVEGKRVQTWLKRPHDTDWRWQPAVDWTQPAAWTPPADRPGLQLGSGTISLQNNPPIDGVVWFKDIQFRELNAAASNAPASTAPDEKLILGSWTRTNMDTPGAAFEMEILPGGQATWIGDGARVKGTWQLTSNTLNLHWNSGFDFNLSPPSDSSPTLMTGKAAWPDGKNTDIRYERTVAVPSVADTLEFTAADPVSGWSFISTRGARWPEVDAVGQGHAILESTDETVHPNNNMTAPRLLRDVTGDFTLETWLDFSGGGSNKFAGSGLLLWHDDMNFIRLERIYADWQTPRHGISLQGRVNGVYKYWVNTDIFPTQVIHNRLRLTRKGGEITAYWLDSTQNWLEVGTVAVSWPAKIQAGIVTTALRGGPVVKTRFDRVSLTTTSPAPPVTASSLLPAAVPSAEEGFVPLFQNDSLSGWTGDLSSYQMRNGILSGGNGNLVNPKEYGDFSLKFDLRLAAGAYVEMSIRGQTPPQPNSGAPNASFGVVLRDNTDASAAALEPWKRHGAVYGYQEPLKTSGGTVGTWNEHEIRVENQHLTVTINGVTVQDTDLRSLTRKAPGGRSLDLSRTRGQLAILGFKGTTEFRNVRIKELGAAATVATAPTAPTTWIDTKGRSLQAKFVRVEGGNVMLDIAGKITPVALATLSSASQALARQHASSMLTSAGAATSPVAPAAAEADFISLLDADRPGDWVQVGPGKLDIQNGAATTSSPTRWGVAIYSKRTFADFILKAEFKGVNPLFNSGLWLRIPDLQNDIDRAAANRYEVGIINPGGDKGRFTGTIWGIQSARIDAVKANDWNELEVTVTGQRYLVKLNGQIVNDFTGSKGVSGYIGLEENFAGPVQFRNVRVKPLP